MRFCKQRHADEDYLRLIFSATPKFTTYSASFWPRADFIAYAYTGLILADDKLAYLAFTKLILL